MRRAIELLLVGGIDPTGGAGLVRDRWAAGALAPGLRVGYVVSGWTRQGDGRPARVSAVPHRAWRDQLSQYDLASLRAVKIGMLPEARVSSCVTWIEGLRRRGVAAPVVVDPVLRATDGGQLGAPPSRLRALLRLAMVVTPNASEAMRIAGASTLEAARPSLRSMSSGTSWLIKSAGVTEAEVADWWLAPDADTPAVWTQARDAGPDPRGTGCALATAIACGLAEGFGPREAAERGRRWLAGARRHTAPGPDGRAHLRSASDPGIGC